MELKKYKAWKRLTEIGTWSENKVPEWARDHTGLMNDGVAKNAVIEELASALKTLSPAKVEGVEPVAWWLGGIGAPIETHVLQFAKPADLSGKAFFAMPLYTAAQLAAEVMKEREACAVEAKEHRYGSHAADAIRARSKEST